MLHFQTYQRDWRRDRSKYPRTRVELQLAHHASIMERMIRYWVGTGVKDWEQRFGLNTGYSVWGRSWLFLPNYLKNRFYLRDYSQFEIDHVKDYHASGSITITHTSGPMEYGKQTWTRVWSGGRLVSEVPGTADGLRQTRQTEVNIDLTKPGQPPDLMVETVEDGYRPIATITNMPTPQEAIYYLALKTQIDRYRQMGWSDADIMATKPLIYALATRYTTRELLIFKNHGSSTGLVNTGSTLQSQTPVDLGVNMGILSSGTTEIAMDDEPGQAIQLGVSHGAGTENASLWASVNGGPLQEMSLFSSRPVRWSAPSVSNVIPAGGLQYTQTLRSLGPSTRYLLVSDTGSQYPTFFGSDQISIDPLNDYPRVQAGGEYHRLPSARTTLSPRSFPQSGSRGRIVFTLEPHID